ncbi:MAG: hypothetical protein ACT4PP_05820 [Sporichthyaceae bacterium]
MTIRSSAEGRVAGVLAEVVAEHGRERLRDPAVLRGVLNDMLGQQSSELRREVELVVRAASEGVPDSLSLPAMPATVSAATERLTSLAIDPLAARWAVATWANALGTTSLPPPEFEPLPGHSLPGRPGVTELVGSASSTPLATSLPSGTPLAQTVLPPRPDLPPAPAPAPAKRRRTGLLVGLGVAVLALAGGGVAGVVLAGGGEDDLPQLPALISGSQLSSLLPAASELGEGEVVEAAGDKFGVNGVCDQDEPIGAQSQALIYLQDIGEGYNAAVRVASFTDAAAASSFLGEVAQQVDCGSFEFTGDDCPDGGLASVTTTRPGPGELVVDATYECPRTTAARYPIGSRYRFVAHANAVGLVQVFQAGGLQAADRILVDTQATALTARLRGVATG